MMSSLHHNHHKSHDINQSHTSKADVAKVHDDSNDPPNVPHLLFLEVEHLHGSADDREVLLVSHVPSVVLVDDVTGHCVALVTDNRSTLITTVCIPTPDIT